MIDVVVIEEGDAFRRFPTCWFPAGVEGLLNGPPLNAGEKAEKKKHGMCLDEEKEGRGAG